MFKGQFKFVRRVVRQGERSSRPRRFGVGIRPEASIFEVVGDVGFCTEGEVDWVTMDDSLDIESMIWCVVYDAWDRPYAIKVFLRLEFLMFVEFCFCNLIV